MNRSAAHVAVPLTGHRAGRTVPGRPQLRLVEGGGPDTGAGVVGQVGRGTYVRRRLLVLSLLVLLVTSAAVAIGRVDAGAQLEQRVAGHVVVEPGQTLWDVAVATAPDGGDPRRQLADLRDLNGIDGSHVDAWAVVLLPAR